MREGSVRRRGGAWIGALAWVVASTVLSGHAHLLADGHGTLNVQDGAAYVVLSLPIGWLGPVDDDRDGYLSPTELHAHRGRILDLLSQGLRLRNGGQSASLRDVLLSPSAAHHRSDGAGTHLLVMGSRALSEPMGAVVMRLQLQGPKQVLQVTATRGPLKELAALVGPDGSVMVFGSWWERLRHN